MLISLWKCISCDVVLFGFCVFLYRILLYGYERERDWLFFSGLIVVL